MGKKFQEIKNKIDKLTDENRFEDVIELIETIPEDERDLELRINHAKTFNNIAMITLGEYDEEREFYEQNDEDDEDSPKVSYIQKAINRLEDMKEEGSEDRFWNKRMALAYYSMGHVLINQSFHYYSLALPYFKKFYELEKKIKKNEALKFLDECRENLADRYLTQKKYLEGFSMIDSLSDGWNGYYPCFDISGIKEQEEKEVDDILSQELDDLGEKGNILLEQGNMDEALKVWQSAIDMIPEPKSMQGETVWFEAAIGDIYFTKKAFNEAQLLFERALSNLSGEGINPFVFMRNGECQYELGNKKLAKHFLIQAYGLEGEEIFKSEEQNIKYLEFLLEEMKKDEEARKHPFKDFDFTDFWDDSDDALESYVSNAF